MSPILKRDVGEHLRHAKRLASAVTGYPPEEGYDTYNPHGSRDGVTGEGFASGSSSRRGIGVEGDEEDKGPPYSRPSWEGRTFAQQEAYRGKARGSLDEEEDEHEDLVYRSHEVREPFIDDTALRNTHAHLDGGQYRSRSISEWAREEVFSMSPSRWVDLRNLLLEVCVPHHHQSLQRRMAT